MSAFFKSIRSRLTWFTANMTVGKSILIMLVVSAVLLAVPIIYTGANPERYLMGDFERWEVWWAIGAVLAGMLTGVLLRRLHRPNKSQPPKS